MTSKIDLYGIHINHTTWGFLRFFVEHINLVVYDKGLKVIKELSVSTPDEFILYIRDQIKECDKFRNFIKDKVDLEFNFKNKMNQLKEDYEKTKKNNDDPTLTNQQMIKGLSIKIGEVSKQYRSLISLGRDQGFDKSYQITLKFYEDVGGKTFHWNYTHDIVNFSEDIFNFFKKEVVEPIIFEGRYAIFETDGKFPGFGGMEDSDQNKYYTICDKTLNGGDCRILGKLIKQWIAQDRISASTSLENLTVSF